MGCLEKVRLGQARLAQMGINIPDYIAQEFAQVANHESGCSHFKSAGVVKKGFPTKYGTAVGFSQILPSTASRVNSRLNINDEIDNIALGLQYYSQIGKDGIARRLAYVSGENSAAVKQYNSTGKVSTARLYSGTNITETYYDYVASTGGFSGASSIPDNVAGNTPPANPAGPLDISQISIPFIAVGAFLTVLLIVRLRN